jgi:hypothetical protein
MKWRPTGKKDADLERELRSDLELEESEQMERGLSPEEARYAARRALGNVTLIREQTRAVWAWNRLDSLARELRYGLRTLGRTPGFTIIAILVMALGMGANIALFTVVRGVLLKPLPYLDPGRLALIYEADNSQRHHSPWLPVDAGSFWDWQRSAEPQAQMAMVSPFQGYNVSAEGGKLPEVVEAAWCTHNFFSLLGVQPMLGRAFAADDDRPGAAATAIITASFWKRRYASDPAIVGKTIFLDAKPYTIIGVLPATFVYSGAFGGNADQVWTPVKHEAPDSLLKTYGDHEFQVVARLAPGVTLAAFEKQIDALQKQIKAAHPEPAVHPDASTRSILDDAVHDYKTPLYALLGATGCVLLIACMNVAGLLVARAASRAREFAIRTALGGGRARLVAERLIESLLLSAAGGALGLLLAWGALQWLVHARSDMNRIEAIRFDGVRHCDLRGLLRVDLGIQLGPRQRARGIAGWIPLQQQRTWPRDLAARSADSGGRTHRGAPGRRRAAVEELSAAALLRSRRAGRQCSYSASQFAGCALCKTRAEARLLRAAHRRSSRAAGSFHRRFGHGRAG